MDLDGISRNTCKIGNAHKLDEKTVICLYRPLPPPGVGEKMLGEAVSATVTLSVFIPVFVPSYPPTRACADELQINRFTEGVCTTQTCGEIGKVVINLAKKDAALKCLPHLKLIIPNPIS